VIGSMARITNLPWQVSAEALAQTIGCGRVRLMNDLETTAYGALFVDPDELLTLNAGVATPGHRAVIAAGTGLGQALLCWDSGRFNPAPTEGGHVDFGPTMSADQAAARRVASTVGSPGRRVSGPGAQYFRYLDEGCIGRSRGAAERLREPERGHRRRRPRRRCPVCSEAIDIFVRLYGAQAGNLALTAMALGGVYVGGGIV
jgi:glucokinase